MCNLISHINETYDGFYVRPSDFLDSIQDKSYYSGLGVEKTAHNRKDRGLIPHVIRKLFTISQMDIVGYPDKVFGAEAYYYLICDSPNDVPSDIKQTAKSMMVGRENNQTNKL